MTLMDYGLSDYEVILDGERRRGGLRKYNIKQAQQAGNEALSTVPTAHV